MELIQYKVTEPKRSKNIHFSYESYYHRYFKIGYYLIDKRVFAYDNGDTWFSLKIDLMVNAPDYTPYISADIDDDCNVNFRIPTISYGSLPIEEIEQIVNGFNHAIEVIRILKDSDVVKKEG